MKLSVKDVVINGFPVSKWLLFVRSVTVINFNSRKLVKMRLEKDVKREIYNKLEFLERMNHILWFERLQSCQIHNGNQHIYMCRPGTSDFICVLTNKKGSLSVIFIEAKREGVYKERVGAQAEFRKSYDGIHEDIIYCVVQSVDDLMSVIDKIWISPVDKIQFIP